MKTKMDFYLDRERGFTLVELLVVIGIIAVLTAIAIPVFLNQRQKAHDAQVTSNVKNIATSIQTALVDNPNATQFSVTGAANNVVVNVGTSSADMSSVSTPVNVDTYFRVVAGTTPGTFKVMGYSTKSGKHGSPASAAVYDSATGAVTSADVPALNVSNGLDANGPATLQPYFSAALSSTTDARNGSGAVLITTVASHQAQGAWWAVYGDFAAGDELAATAWVKAPVGMKYAFGLRSLYEIGRGHGQNFYVGNGDWQQVSASYKIGNQVSTWYAPQIITESSFPAIGTRFTVDDITFTATPGAAPAGSDNWVTAN